MRQSQQRQAATSGNQHFRWLDRWLGGWILFCKAPDPGLSWRGRFTSSRLRDHDVKRQCLVSESFCGFLLLRSPPTTMETFLGSRNQRLGRRCTDGPSAAGVFGTLVWTIAACSRDSFLGLPLWRSPRIRGARNEMANEFDIITNLPKVSHRESERRAWLFCQHHGNMELWIPVFETTFLVCGRALVCLCWFWFAGPSVRLQGPGQTRTE